MSSTSRKAYSHGFFLAEQELRRIHDIANTQMKKALIDKPYYIEFGLIYKNGVVEWRSDFESIFSEENIQSSSVQSIKMHCFDDKDDSTIEIFIEFRNPTELYERHSILYRVLGNERDWVFITSSQLDERIKRTKRNNTITKHFNRGIDGVISYILLSFVLGGMAIALFSVLGERLYPRPIYRDSYYYAAKIQALDGLVKDWKEGKIKDAVEVQIEALKITNNYSELKLDPTLQKELDENRAENEKRVSKRNKYFTFIVIIVVLIAILLPSTKYFRPPYVFYWGENIKAIDKKANAGKFLLLGVIVAVLIGLATNYIYDVLKQ
jgi:hypothetical protein